ncbi:MAG TPA: alpha/beta fold hydrolase [Xanthobacteraceae bacterium]|nr:alpha/beta fold hydrolase [Xanthobacteraceae bacterium]
MPLERFDFPNASGLRLAAVLDRPLEEPRAYALFAHCFTCGKDNFAASRIAHALADRGVAVLRFDFTGIGASEGEFANAGFSANVADLVAASDHLRRTHQAPALLIGHSLGGAAVLAAAAEISEARAVVTIAAPADPAHVTGLFKDRIPEINANGEAEVVLAGRSFQVRREFLEDLVERRLIERIARLHKALLVFHSPSDATVGIDNASRIFTAAKHPKSFISLADADHLLSRKSDAAYVGNVIAAWADRYLDHVVPVRSIAEAAISTDAGSVVVTENGRGVLQQDVAVGRHRLIADEPVSAGGLDGGPDPYGYLLTALGACTAMTLRLYANRKSLPLRRISVALKHGKIYAADCETCETKEGMLDLIERTVSLEGDLDAGMRAKLLEIADKCPVHRTLTSEVAIRTRLVDTTPGPVLSDG